MPEDLLAGPRRPRQYAGRGWLWLCWDGLVTIEDVIGTEYGSLATSLDGGQTVVPLRNLGGRPLTNVRIAPPPAGKLRIAGQVVARGGGPRHSRTLAFETVDPWPPGTGLEVESSSSEMLFRCEAPPRGAAWRMVFHKRWLAIQHLSVARPGALEHAANLLAGGLEGGALPRLQTIPAGYGVRAARGFFNTSAGEVRYRGVQLGPLVYDMTFAVRPDGLEVAIERDAMAECLAFEACALAFPPADAGAAAVEGRDLRLRSPGAVAIVTAEPPLRWDTGPDGTPTLAFDDPANDLGLRIVEGGQRRGRARIAFEPA